MVRRSPSPSRMSGAVLRAAVAAVWFLSCTFALVTAPMAQELQSPSAMPSIRQGQERTGSADTLQPVADVIAGWDGRDVGALFVAVKATNPQKGAIDTIRELNKAIKEKKASLGDAEASVIAKKLAAAQAAIKEKIISVRKAAFARFAIEHPDLIRTFSAAGDVGSWPTSDDINSDVDWTVFGTDPAATRRFVDQFYDPMLLTALAGEGSGLDLRSDFDIVVTPEGWEGKAGVFETSGGKALAKTVMSRVIPINADGTLGTATGTDVAAELENTKVQARLRELATKMGVYDKVFDAKGNFLGYGAFSRSQFPTEEQIAEGFKRVGRDPATDAAIDDFLEAADEEGLLRYDSKIVRRSTLAGTCLDMVKHLHHEAIEKLGTLDRKGQIKRIMKYPGRSEWAYGKSSIPPGWVEDYVVMGDAKMRRLVELSGAFHKAKESKPTSPKKTAAASGDQDPSKPADTKPVNEALERMIAVIADEFPDSHELGRLAETMIIRQAHLAMQVQLDEIVRSADPAERGRMLQALIDDFGVVDEPGPFQAFAQAQKQALTEFKKVSDDPVAFEKLKTTYQHLDTLTDPNTSRTGEHLRGFLKQSELGGKLLEIHDRAKDLAERVKKQTDRVTLQLGEVAVTIETVGDHLRETSQLFRFVENAKQDLEAIRDVGSMPTADLQNVLDRVGTAIDILQAVGDAKTDADLAYNLGKALWDNSGVGGIVNTLYAFTVGGDNEAMGKFVMFALCPPGAIPELVAKIGNFTARTGAQKLFDMQLEALYAASRFADDPAFVDDPAWKDKDPWLLADFVGYGAGVPAVEEFLNTLLLPGGYREAESMIVSRVSNLLSEATTGTDVLMKAAVVKAIWVTLMLGDPVVLGDDADLADAAQRVKLLTDDIVFLAAQLGKEVARAPENFRLPDGLSKGEQAALVKLVAERDVWVGKAKTAMAAAIVRTFEERHRADIDLSGKEMEKRMEELRALLTRLDVLEPGLYHLGEEGYYNFLQRNLPFFGRSNTEQQRKLMAAINRYFDAYSQILSLRDALTQIIQIRTAAAPLKAPLTGAPPMCGERKIDLSAALRLFEKITKAGEATRTTLTNLKGAALAGPFDDRIRRAVDTAAIDMARAEVDGELARACRELHWRSEVIDRNRFTEDSAASTERFAAAQHLHQAAIDEFIAFYAALKALQPKIELKPAAPVQGDPVTANLTVTGGAVPADALWVWTLDDAGRKTGSWRGTAITFEAPFRGRYTLSAALTLSGVAVKTVSHVFSVTARPGLTLRLVPPDPPPEGAIDAEARFEPAPTPAGALWEWRCEGCAVVAAKAERARLKAPAKGAGVVHVRLVAGDGAGRRTIAEAKAPFRVDTAKKPGDQTTSQDGSTPPPGDTSKPGTDDTPPPPGPPETPKPPTDVTGKPTPPILLPVHELSSWYGAMLDHEEMITISRRADLPAGDRDRVAAELVRIEAQMKAYWDHAAREVAMAVDYTERIRAAIVKVHDHFAGKTAGPMQDSGNVVDLEGETVASRNNACIQAVERDRTRDLGYVDDDLKRLRGFHARFKSYSPDRSVYHEAMRGHDNLSVDHDKTRWKTRGYERTFYNPCGGPPVKVTLPPANVPPKPPPSPATALGTSPTVTLSLDPASRGRVDATVVAKVSGGNAPYAFAWAGARSSSGGRAVYIRPIGKGPPVKAEIRVSDATGRSATATLPLDPVVISLQLTRTAPAGADLPVGAKADFEVRLSGEAGGVDARSFVLRWEPSTEAAFEKPEGAGLTTNSATWSRVGKARVWVTALLRNGPALVTVGESNQIEFEVIGSAVELEARPSDPLVGQEVTIRARETPPVSDADASWWWEASGEVAKAGPTADPRVYTFVAEKTGPITVTTHLKEKIHGDELAKASKTVTVRPYTVKVVPLGPAFENSTTRPVVWRPGKGLVTLDRAILPDMDVGFRADITPTPATSQIRYRWRVQEGATLTGNPVSRETRARRSDAGAIAVTVEVRDADDTLLGSAGGSVTVSVSTADLATGRQKTADLERLKREAARAWSGGDLETACRSASAAAELDPGFAVAKARCAARDRVAGLVRDAEAAIGEKTLQGLERAKKRIAEIGAINAAAKVIGELEKKVATTTIEDPRKVERKRRMDQIRVGAEACTKADWTKCRASIAGALEGGGAVFEPGDAGTITKARTLLDMANRALAEAGRQKATADAERDRRRREILIGARLCGESRWRECRDRLTGALAGAETVFRTDDADMLAKANALLARAERMLRTSR